jgi:hypothetical protein
MIRYKHMSAGTVETQRLTETEGSPDFETLAPDQLEAWLIEEAVTEAGGRYELLISTAELLPAGSPHFETLANRIYDESLPLTLRHAALCAISRSNYSGSTAAWEAGLDFAGLISTHSSRGKGRIIDDPKPYADLANGQTNPRHLDMLRGNMTGRDPAVVSPVLLAIGKAQLDAGETDVSELLGDKRITVADRGELLVHQVKTYAKAGRLVEARRAVYGERLSRELDLQAELHVAAVQRGEYRDWDIIKDELRDPHTMSIPDRQKIIGLLLEGERSDLALQLAASIPLSDGRPSPSGDAYKDAMLTIAKHQAFQGDTFTASETLDAAAKEITLNRARAAQQLGRYDFRSEAARLAKTRLQHSEIALEDITRMRGRILAITQPFKMYEAIQLVAPKSEGAQSNFLLARTLIPDLAEAGRIKEAIGLAARVGNAHCTNKSEWYVTLAKAARQQRQRQMVVWVATSSQVTV